MRILVLGYGSMGKRHAANARALRHDVTVYDPRLHEDGTLGEPIKGVRYVTGDGPGAERAWASDPDAVVIATPAATHAVLLARALLLDGHPRIYVEKPLALTAADVPYAPTRQIVVGYNLRSHAGLRHFREYLLPRAGAPLVARFEVSCDRATWPGTAYADTLLECSHEIDLACWCLGPATLLAATTVSAGDQIWEILLRHATGAISTVRLDARFRGYRRRGEVVGTAGVAKYGWHAPTGGFLTSFTEEHGKTPAASYKLRVTPEQTYMAALACWLAGSEPCPLAEGRAVLEICDAARAAAERAAASAVFTRPARSGSI